MSPLWLAAALALSARAEDPPKDPLAIPPSVVAESSAPVQQQGGPLVPTRPALRSANLGLSPRGQEQKDQPSDDPGDGVSSLFDGAKHRAQLTMNNEVVAGRVGVGTLNLPKGAGSLETGVRAGVIHPGARQGLANSPYAAVDVKAEGTKGLDWTFRASNGLMRQNSSVPGGDAGRFRSPAAWPGGDKVSIVNPVSSAYLDVGKTARVTDGVSASVFGGWSGWQALGDGNAEANAGVGLGLRTSRRSVLTASVDANRELATPTMYRNEFHFLPEAVRARLGWTHEDDDKAIRAGFEAASGEAASWVQPSIAIMSWRRMVELSGRFQKAKSDFLPSERGAALSWTERLSERVSFESTAALLERRYAGSPQAYRTGTGYIGFNIDTGKIRAGAKPLKPIGTPKFDPKFAAAKVDPALKTDAGLIATTLGFAQAGSFEEFSKIIAANAKSYDELLSVLARVGGQFNDFNYNHTEHDPENKNNLDDIFKDVQASWRDGEQRKTGVCITQSQFNAAIVRRWAELTGQNVKAMTGSFNVPTEGGKKIGGHSLLAIIGPDGKVTIQDWRGLAPMGTGDVLAALKNYQELAGVPSAYFGITDPKDGRHQAFAFTPEGRAVLENATVMGREKPGYRWTDDVHGADLTLDRFEKKTADRAKKRED